MGGAPPKRPVKLVLSLRTVSKIVVSPGGEPLPTGRKVELLATTIKGQKPAGGRLLFRGHRRKLVHTCFKTRRNSSLLVAHRSSRLTGQMAQQNPPHLFGNPVYQDL